jgi:hypothetical protein
MKAATSRLEQSKEAASKGVNMGRKIMKDTSSRTMQSKQLLHIACSRLLDVSSPQV